MISNGEKMVKESRRAEDVGEEIRIPMESIERIDNIILSGKTFFKSRDDFVKSAVERKLRELQDFSSSGIKK